jgi:hypothetical protein
VLSTTASGRMNLIGVTLVDNRADADGGNGGNGGGLRIEGNFALITDTVFAGNRVGSGSGAQCDKGAVEALPSVPDPLFANGFEG